MLLFVGLGNPAPNSENNRHNVGFKIIDSINKKFSLSKQKPKFKGLLTTGNIDNKKLVPEGIEGMVPYRGPVKNTVHQIIGGIRSSMGYSGCVDLDDFSRKSEFIEITNAGVKESHPHDVRIVKEAPNYSASDS